ncbi:hypothetical protein CICLE_v10003721mg, partial [Citrus x clementina]
RPRQVKTFHIFPSRIFDSYEFKNLKQRGKEMETKEEGVKLQIAIRCAKALNLLSSLRNRDLKATTNDDDEEKETMKRIIGDLQVELARERLTTKKLKLSGLMELVLQVAMLLFVSAYLLIIAFNVNEN